jgi:hypothetical protein
LLGEIHENLFQDGQYLGRRSNCPPPECVLNLTFRYTALIGWPFWWKQVVFSVRYELFIDNIDEVVHMLKLKLWSCTPVGTRYQDRRADRP